MFTLNNISRRYGARVIFNKLNYNFPENKIIALIGANGAGKTTLLNIICALEAPDDGNISKPKSMVVGYLPQEPNPDPKDNLVDECVSGAGEIYSIKVEMDAALKEMEENYTPEIYEKYEALETQYRNKDGYLLETNAKRILNGLGFKQEQFDVYPKSLSGGWRMRLELAKILLKNPDFLVLDEPTNHLDLPSILWLEGYLEKFKGTLLFVSHDEDLLNRLPQVILHLKGGKLNEYHGNFNSFLEQYEQSEAAKASSLQGLDKKIDQLSVFVDKFKAKASKATQARSKMKMIARLENEASQIDVDKADAEISIKIPLTQKSGKDVLELTKCTTGYPEKILVKDISMFVERGQKIAILGANGLGKSTLLRSIVGEIPFLDGENKLGHNVKIAFYAQDQLGVLDLEASAIENLMRVNPKLTMQEARKLLGGFLLKGDDAFKKVHVLSGGEKSRLSLSCMMAQDANFLLLDEPTNHLDMASTDVLAQALSDYEGTAMFVSHNRKFIDNVATHIFVISQENKGLLFRGNLSDNLEKESLAQLFGMQDN